MRLQDFLFSHPVIKVKTVEKLLDVSTPTANSLVADLEKLGVLREWTGRRRNRSWMYKDYLNIFSDAELRP